MENSDETAANSGVSSHVTETEQQLNPHQQNGEQQRLLSGGRFTNREERLKLLKERQYEERLKKLEELKQNAIQAARVREEQDIRRRKQFEDFSKKEDEKRRQAEERRRQLDDERKSTLQTKWENKKLSLAKTSGGQLDRPKPIFAFGSCTPRLVENFVDGCLWKSTYNLNSSTTPRELPVKSTTSAQDLHSQLKMSRSMYEWNQQRTTFNIQQSSPPTGIKYRKSRTMELDSDRVFCGRRKTDLTPTIPIRREDGSNASRSASRAATASGRVYASMTRLDHGPGSRSPVRQQLGMKGVTTRSKSTTQLGPSVASKLTRTEILRQNLIRGKENGPMTSPGEGGGTRSGNATPSRPPSSMSSLMTSSTHSHVPMRPRSLSSRKSRPISVHVTGVDSSKGSPPPQPLPAKTFQEQPLSKPPTHTRSRSAKVEIKDIKSPSPPPLSTTKTKTPPPPKKVSESKPKITPPTQTTKKEEVIKKKPEIDTSTIRRGKMVEKKKELKEKRVDKASETGESSPATTPTLDLESRVIETVTIPIKQEPLTSEPAKEDSIGTEQQVEIEMMEQEPQFVSFIELEKPADSLNGDVDAAESFLILPVPAPMNFEAGNESKLTITVNGDDNHHPVFTNPFAVEAIGQNPFLIEESVESNNPFAPAKEITRNGSPMLMDELITETTGAMITEGKPKLLTEEDAKSALADKRRLAREAQERELARLEEEARMEEERQRLEVEEAERLALEAREMEEERLRVAIEEQKQKEIEEKKRREEEELARQDRENEEREAAKEAERIRAEMEERLKREEEERLERKRRVEAIMSRTRKTGTESGKSTTPVPEDQPEVKFSNGVPHGIESTPPTTMTSVMNNLNNNYSNNDLTSTLIDFGDISSPLATPLQPTTNSSNNTQLINTGFQDLLS